MKNCHDCGVKPGELHKEGCDSPHCTVCGIQLLQCGHYPEGNSIHSGVENQEIKLIAEVLGLYTKWGLHCWTECSENDERARYDLNKASIIYYLALQKIRNKEGI